MEALNKINNVEKGRLIAALFPEETERIVAAVKSTCDYLFDNEQQIRQEWDVSFIPAELWYRIAANLRDAIAKNGNRIFKNKRTFADQLFDGYNAMLTIDCIVKSKYGTDDAKFRQAVELFFE